MTARPITALIAGEMSNPGALSTLTGQCQESGAAHALQELVTPTAVAQWLQSLNLGQHSAAVIENGVDGYVMVDLLRTNNLPLLGITNELHMSRVRAGSVKLATVHKRDRPISAENAASAGQKRPRKKLRSPPVSQQDTPLQDAGDIREAGAATGIGPVRTLTISNSSEVQQEDPSNGAAAAPKVVSASTEFKPYSEDTTAISARVTRRCIA